MNDTPLNLGELQAEIEALLQPRDGVDGRDGRDGIDGRDGKDADPALVRAIVEEVLADQPQREDAITIAGLRVEVQRQVASIVTRDGKRGPQGERGATGRTGPMPRHEWDGTKLRFEQVDGTWGEWIDLRGPRGPRGQPGGGSVADTHAKPTFSYMPTGW